MKKVPINSLWRIGRKWLLSSQQTFDSSQQITSAERFVFLTSASKHQTIIMRIASCDFFKSTEAPTFLTLLAGLHSILSPVYPLA